MLTQNKIYMCELLELSVGKKSEGNKKEKEENRTKLSGN